MTFEKSLTQRPIHPRPPPAGSRMDELLRLAQYLCLKGREIEREGERGRQGEECE